MSEHTGDNQYRLEISGDMAALSIFGPLRAELVNGLKGPILKAMLSAPKVFLKAESFRGADMAIIQLLCAACQSARLMSKKIYLEGEGVDEFLVTAESAGFSQDSICCYRESEDSDTSYCQERSEG